MGGARVAVGGPFFEDLKVGQVFDDAPSLTLTPGHAAMYQAMFGDRMRLPLDQDLSRRVSGRAEPLAHPMLVCHVAIGQSTGASQRVLGNLFYRGVALLAQAHIGDTLHTETEVVALRQNRSRPGRAATGVAVLRVRSRNQHGEPVLDFLRCPMIPLADPEGRTGHADPIDDPTGELDPGRLVASVPDWRLDVFTEATPGVFPRFGDLTRGATFTVEARDTVTAAPELARMTLNLAMTHTDPDAGAHGRRLVYGGHTISTACAQTQRALPSIVTLLAWRSCDHLGPVFEGDVLRTEVTVEATKPLGGGAGIVELRARVWATGNGRAAEEPVLDWRFAALVA